MFGKIVLVFTKLERCILDCVVVAHYTRALCCILIKTLHLTPQYWDTAVKLFWCIFSFLKKTE